MSRPQVPGRILAVAAIVLAEAVALVVFAIAEAASVSSQRLGLGITTAVFFALYAAALAWCAWGITQLSGWSRGPIVLTQLILLGVAWSFRGGDTTVVAVALAVPALLALGIVLAPATTTILYGDDPSAHG